MRILTYNIHKGIGGLDRRYSLDRTLEVLAQCDADLVLLQEVDHDARRTRFHRQADIIADALGLTHMAVSVNHRLRGGGGYGNVTLSRFPIVESSNLDLSMRFKKRRGALYTRVNVGGGALHVFNVHLGLLHFERAHQARRLLSSPSLQDAGDAPVVVAGDTNDWTGRLCRRVLAPSGFSDVCMAVEGRRMRTFPALAPVLPLDRMYFRGLAPTALIRSESNHVRHASDHRPLAADFVLAG